MYDVKAEEVLTSIYSMCPVSIEEARELSWRKFYDDVGGKENLKNIDGTTKLKKLLKNSEKCFEDILMGKLTEEELKNLINLPLTDLWISDYNSRPIHLKGIEV